jgi:tRNA(fMet)-specific endonuclease VapC
LTGFLLDSDICIYAIRGAERVHAAMRAAGPATIFVSAISEAELRAGAAKSNSPVKAARAIDRLLEPLLVLEFGSDDARAYARVRASLERAGTPIGPLDTLIGAQALARGLTLVTNNEREFSRIAGISLVNWTS